MNNTAPFIPFDIKCYTKLHEKFEFLFEPELINEICHLGTLKKFEGGQVIMDINQQVTHIPLIVSGSVKIMTEDEEGHELLLYYLELGDTCAITLNCCTSSAKSAIRAVTEESTELLFIPVEQMDTWMTTYKKWRVFVLDSYNTRVMELLKAVDNLAFHNMDDRLKRYLKDKVWVSKSDELNITHYEIANDLNSSRVVISRLMKKLEKEGLIKQGRNRVKILNYTEW
tara:strand:- start:2123 stop:2803 length:681 start_codon:yes stop_codon:yes gene_type:complete